ncbi:hypothetical protein RugamoR57_20820 [Duganella caerulea]|uniref:DUF2628 domain-containing protein n=1 Tax=Duganella caerulea TaxID=2885762 RepID=UPI0030E95908
MKHDHCPKETNVDDCKTAGTSLPSDLPQIWRIRFDLIELAGGPNLPRKKKLTSSERMRTQFNVWAFLFGPLYYLAKGMWRKALAYWLIGFMLLFVVEVTMQDIDWTLLEKAVGIATTALYALRANIDYYKKMVLHDNGWW